LKSKTLVSGRENLPNFLYMDRLILVIDIDIVLTGYSQETPILEEIDVFYGSM